MFFLFFKMLNINIDKNTSNSLCKKTLQNYICNTKLELI